MQKLNNIDGGKPFDWGKTSQDYAKYRDIYPEIFYQKIADRGLCVKGQKVLDIGTGTGVLPRNMYRFGAEWTGTDISPNQIEQAVQLAQLQNMKIDFIPCPAEEIDFPENSFDIATACQCIWYPDHKILAPKLAKVLKKGGRFLILYMAWLPYEDKIAARSEDIILKYNPSWNSSGEIRKPMWVPDEYLEFFDVTYREEYDVNIPFTRDSWHGRMRACRGVGASLSDEALKLWEEEHGQMLENEAPPQFDVLHYVAMAELTLKDVK
jgi:SAM-dependent methyltransferase